MNAPANFERIFTLAQGPPLPEFPAVGANGRFKAPDGVNPSIMPETQRLPFVDAWNLTVQRELTHDISGEIAYVGNKGTHVFAGDGPDVNFNQPTLVGFPNVQVRDQAEYNKLVRFFPTNLTAKLLLHAEVKPNFTVADETVVAKPPEVKF